MLTGTFGIGKTAAVRLFAMRKAKELGLIFSQSFEDVNDEKKFVFLVLPLHQYEPAEIKGLPFPNAERTQTVYLPVGLLPTKGQGIILLDEINLAPPMLQSNAYQLIEDRRLGFYTVPDGVMIIGAGNRDDDRGHTFDMAMPLNNRFLHAELAIPPVDDIEVSGEKIKGWATDYAIPSGVDHRIVN
jgi:MoxR-like ATPase